MKKNLLYLFALICSVSLFTACSDDDDKVNVQDLSKEYTGADLELSLDGATVTGKTVKFVATSATVGTLTLNGIVPEVEEVVVDLAVAEVNGGYSFEGSKDMTGYVISVEGNVTNAAKMTVKVITKGWDMEEKEYTADNLALTINGEVDADKTASFRVVSNTKAELTLKNLFEGVDEFTIPVEMVITRSDLEVKNYTFQGTQEAISGYFVSAEGTINTAGKLTLTLETGGWKTFAAAYENDNLLFKDADADKVLEGRIVKVAVDPESNGTKATLTFDNKYLTSLSVNNLKDMEVTLTREGTSYKIEGEKKYSDLLTFVATGTIDEKKLELTLSTPVFTKLRQGIVGVWKIKTEDDLADIVFDLSTESGNLNIPAEIGSLIPLPEGGTLPEIVPTSTITTLVKAVLGKYAVQLNSIEFGKEKVGGYYPITVTYTEIGSTTPSKLENILRYMWNKEDGLYIGLDIWALMPASRAYDGSTLLTDGILFRANLSEDGTLALSIDKNIILPTINMLGVMVAEGGFLDAILPMIPNLPENFPETLTTIRKVIPLATDMITSTKTCEVGLKFVKE